jgi:hypothetical protein
MAFSPLNRALGVVLVLLVAGCSSEPPEPVYVAPNYTYLKPLRVNVGAVVIQDAWTPGPDDIGMLSPVRPIDALHRMAQDRLVATGTAGRAVFTIEDASIRRVGDSVTANFIVRLAIENAGGVARGYAEARVTRATAVPDDAGPLRQTLYTLTTQMMRDMNVELEYQLRRALHDWLEETAPASSAVPAPVEQQPLPAPGEQRRPPASGF